MSGDLEEFEDILQRDFNPRQFANDVLKATNNDSDHFQLDIETSIKKIKYDIREVESRIDKTIDTHPWAVLEQIDKTKLVNSTLEEGLKPSLQYLDLSYGRLQDEVLIPYEKAQKLQSALSKVHQTSTLLRDSLIYIHLLNKITTLNNSMKTLTMDNSIQLASLYTQLQYNLEQNQNLKSLKVIKNYESSVIQSNKKKLIDFLVLTLSKECLNTFKLQNNQQTIAKLSNALFLVSPQDFTATIHRIILSNVATNSQILQRTINSIKNFNESFKEVVNKSHDIFRLEQILSSVKTDNNSNILTEYSSQRKPKFSTPRELFWSKISSNFKKDLEVSLNRGGPVGKSLLKNKDLVFNSINELMPLSTDNNDYQNDLKIMLNSVSALSKQQS
ncbi:hypothetical protein KAFR_0H03510 [Kazachstania africana CBS 2517]|uniref:Conserved oligomeric Golgi complex subunit 5 n=1 Tax=Kazachstania africana (strain ATCC 22294 / BCRC 22015 / CBS 2517 / CECT 1963 / NBRC 1671 / NRRL Y-8276) TaxID=1071382 RepID=H2AYI4_KAZAF|nr:hypothetical protein KAFR_0H03510 [Kazachstania africana CBS 2517]CCF59761.1 hypothetical protein KAFR_0H03510 [Kazachstania africana CBS 2517]